jgi:DUF1680 family protein
MIPTSTYVKGKDALYVNLFIGSTVTVEGVAGTDVQMVQKTDYPWSGNVSITVQPKQPKRFAMHVRVPDRTTSKLYSPTPEVNGLRSFSVNGQAVNPKIEKGYAVVTREWQPGDRIELVLPMEVQRIKADPQIAATRGLAALRYGPLIYNVESVDQPDIQQPLGDAPLTTEWRGDLLGGIKVIQGEWANGSPLLAIPNYARQNRIESRAVGAEEEPAADRRRGRAASSIVWIKDE